MCLIWITLVWVSECFLFFFLAEKDALKSLQNDSKISLKIWENNKKIYCCLNHQDILQKIEWSHVKKKTKDALVCIIIAKPKTRCLGSLKFS